MTFRPRRISLLLSRALVCATLACLTGAQTKSPDEVLATKNVMVPMRDGVRLATDIYRPSRGGVAESWCFPTILVRTPYTRAYRAEGADQFVSRGYALVVQSVRGRYGSEGHWRFFQDDPADGYDTSAWIASQPWSDGAIGSYEGGTQHAMALAQPPALKAMVPFVAATDPGRYGIRHKGAFELRFFTWLFTVGNPVDSPDYPAYYPGDQITQQALAAAVVESLAGA